MAAIIPAITITTAISTPAPCATVAMVCAFRSARSQSSGMNTNRLRSVISSPRMRPDSRSSPRGSAREASANVTSQSVRCGSFDGTTDTSLSEAASMPNRSEMARRTS